MMKNLLLLLLLIFPFTVRAQWGVDTDDDNFAPSTKVTFTETNLPLVFLNVEGKTIQKDSYILATMKVIDNGDGHNYRDTTAYPNQTVNFEGYAAVKYRGNSSFYNSKKKPLAIRPLETNDVSGKKKKVVMLGMGKKGDNNWVMLAPWEDKTYSRDLLTFILAKPYMDYVPQGKFCELILDGTYYGIYILCEKVSKGKDRLNLNDPGEDGSLTGDYHIEIDRDDEDHYYTSKYHPLDGNGNELTNKTITYQYDDPEYEDFMDEEFYAAYPNALDTLHALIDQMENAFASDDYTNSETGYRKYIDVTSFIDYELSTEFTNNIDGYRLSTHMYKYSVPRAAKKGWDSRWKMTLWDFNIAYGNASYYKPNDNVWRYEANEYMYNADNQLVPFFWSRLMADESYVKELKSRWREYRSGSYTETNITNTIDSLVSVLQANDAVTRDNKAWSYHFGSLSSNVTTLKNFITKRLKFMDAALLDDESTSIHATTAANREVQAIYSIDGLRLPNLQRGVNLVRYSDGKVSKVLIK